MAMAHKQETIDGFEHVVARANDQQQPTSDVDAVDYVFERSGGWEDE